MSAKTVIKRGGTKENFNVDKIKNAVKSAFKAIGEEVPDEVYKRIDETDFKDNLSVEDIQDIVEDYLMDVDHLAAKMFILYRETHKQARLVRSRLDYMQEYAYNNENAASSSETDANSNVSVKNVANLEGEVYKLLNRTVQRQRMKDELNKLFPNSGLGHQYINDLRHHIIYQHDESSTPVLKFYCQADSLYPLMTEGVGNIDGVTPTAPNDLESFCGQMRNLVFLLSSQCKGATAYAGYNVALAYYIRTEFGLQWYNKLDVVYTNEHTLKQHTIRHRIAKAIKDFIWSINQPAGNRSFNSPFTNISWFDKYYFQAMYGDFYYPDGTKPKWEEVDVLQRMEMQILRELRLITPLTFPVTTTSLLYDEKTKEFKDPEYYHLACEEYAKGGSFFTYMNSNPASLASCCFSKDTKFMWKSSTSGVHITTFEEFMKLPYTNQKENFKVFHNGSWVSGKVISLPNREMYKVTTHNNKEFILTDNHINVTYTGEKPTAELTTDDYLMFNTRALQAIPELDEHLTYEQGFVVGSFLGDGSFGASIKGTIYQMEISQNEAKYKKTIDLFNIANAQLGGRNSCTLKGIVNNKYPVSLDSKEMIQFIIKWTNWSRGTTAPSKELNMNCLLQSIEFRKGILDGWYHTDGGNSNRCYTTSKKLVECMEALITSLGMNSIIDVSDRTDQPVIIRGAEFQRNYPLYCVRWYTPANHRVCKNNPASWKFKNNSIYFKIKSIEKVKYNDQVYCVECSKDEPYFTLPSGLITHNCRVLNEMEDNTFSSTTGMNGEMTGSCNVMTLNLNRIVQDWARQPAKEGINVPNYTGLKEYLCKILERVYKYQIAFKTMLYDMEDKGMFAASNGNYIYMKKLYSTIGVIGYMEAAEFLGLEIGYNENYINFLEFILGTIRDENKKHSILDKKRPFKFNTEAIPGENLGVKLYNWDKEDGYKVTEGRERYSCYFFNPWDNNISVLDKLKLHGGNIAKSISGGQACHVNLDAHLSESQYEKLLQYAAQVGCNYFTFNIPMSKCDDCGHVVNAPISKCPKCGSTHVTYYTRIIGYLTAVKNWSDPMQKEFTQRIYTDKTIGEIVKGEEQNSDK